GRAGPSRGPRRRAASRGRRRRGWDRARGPLPGRVGASVSGPTLSGPAVSAQGPGSSGGPSCGSWVVSSVVVSSVALVQQMVEERVEHRDAVLHPSPGAGQVDHEAAAGQARETAAEQCGGDLRSAAPPHLIEDAGPLTYEERGRLLRGGVAGADAGAAGGDHDVRAGRDRGGERLPDRGPVADHATLHGLEPALLEPRDQERPGAVLVGAVRGAGGGD